MQIKLKLILLLRTWTNDIGGIYDYSTKALKPESPYKVEKEEIGLTECIKNIFEDL